jgi:serine/threonine protein kinase/tetratricopeptide (TPR) repeat protein
MNKDRWKKVNRIFHAALEVPASERERFVLTASQGDPSLQAEVEILLKADEQAGSYLESPLIAEELLSNTASPVSPGDVLCGRFRILRAVGEGGMGHVFAAYDSELGVNVALKVIRPEVASNPDALARFRQEVRLARRITHPNACRTFDIDRETRAVDPVSGAKQELVFLTMEFLEGETLGSRIKRTGALPLDQSLEIARQVSEPMCAAHALGIIHRDLKPANIMLVPPGTDAEDSIRAVITDFGLARMDTALPQGDRSSLSHSGRPIGTIAYMAPEQLEGTAVSAATDVYAFGLMLFEMVTGARAFPSDNFLTGIARRLNGPPPAAESLVPGLPASWRNAIEGCLRLKPTDRFQSTAHVIAVLEGGRAKLSRPGEPTRLQPIAPAFWSVRRRLSFLLGVLIAVVALFLGGYRIYRTSADSKVNPGALVYLTQVKNLTGEPALDNLTELFQAGLEQSAQINLLDQSRVGDTLQLMTKAPDTAIDQPLAREIAMRTGAVRVVFATVTGSRGSYKLDVDIQQPDNTPTRYREHWSKSFSWTTSASTASSATIPPELLTAVRNTSDWIRFKVGESRNDIALLNAPPEDVTTNNWRALEEYTAAEGMQLRLDTTRSIAALQSAVSLDPHFSLAYGRLGDLLFSAGRVQEGLQAYNDALESGQERRLSQRERSRIVGEYALDSHDYPTAEKAYREITLFYPNEYNGWSYRGYPLLMMGRTEEAIDTLKRAYAIDPTRGNAPWELARANLAKGDFSEALRWAEVLKKQGSPETHSYIQGAIQFLNNNFGAASDAFRSMQRSQKTLVHSWSYELLARVAVEQGHSSEAIEFLQEGILFDKQNGQNALEARKLMAAAYVLALNHQYTSCIEALHESLDRESGPQQIMLASSALGVAYHRAPRENAVALRKELSGLQRRLSPASLGVISDMARLRVKGEILLARGDAPDAVRVFKQAAGLDASANGREYLARALDAESQAQPEPRIAEELRRAALTAYAQTALRPDLLWFDSADNLPGYYSQQLSEFIRLAKATPGNEAQMAAAVKVLRNLRAPKVFAK